MKLETIKSLTLVFLIGVSLLLTFGLWTYQSNSANKADPNDNVESSENFGGEGGLATDDLIIPSSIIFHNDNGHFGFSDPTKELTLYEDMQSWTLYNFQLTQINEEMKNARKIAVEFPTILPMSILKSLFNFSKEQSLSLPEWSFKHFLITFKDDSSVMEFHFISADGELSATARVNNPSAYDKLMEQMTEKTDLSKLTSFDKGGNLIYLPLNEVTLLRRQYTVDRIDEEKVANELFPTTLVDKTGNFYNDGTRSLRIASNNLSMEFDNSALPDDGFTRLPIQDLLEYSRVTINNHKGWTGEYRLIEINSEDNMVRYRMFYKGYPTYSNLDLSTIEQYWREDWELYAYNRPLISLNDILFEAEEVTLRSGSEVISYLERQFSVVQNLEEIENIKVGYEYWYNSDNSTATLNPAWFMKIDDSWRMIDFEPKKGGVVDAVESN